jgi:hypothetical protein
MQKKQKRIRHQTFDQELFIERMLYFAGEVTPFSSPCHREDQNPSAPRDKLLHHSKACQMLLKWESFAVESLADESFKFK